MSISPRERLRRSCLERTTRLQHLYWAAKSRLYYRYQFRMFGKGSVICRPLYIRYPGCIEIGERTYIRDGVRLEAVLDPYGRQPRLSIGSNTNIEQNVHIVCHHRVAIGSSVSITGHCAIVDVTHPYKEIYADLKIGARIADEDSVVEIGDGAFLGYGAVVLPNVRIGRNAVIGANSVVTKDVPDFGVVAGAPAVLLKVFDVAANEWRYVKPARKEEI